MAHRARRSIPTLWRTASKALLNEVRESRPLNGRDSPAPGKSRLMTVKWRARNCIAPLCKGTRQFSVRWFTWYGKSIATAGPVPRTWKATRPPSAKRANCTTGSATRENRTAAGASVAVQSTEVDTAPRSGCVDQTRRQTTHAGLCVASSGGVRSNGESRAPFLSSTAAGRDLANKARRPVQSREESARGQPAIRCWAVPGNLVNQLFGQLRSRSPACRRIASRRAARRAGTSAAATVIASIRPAAAMGVVQFPASMPYSSDSSPADAHRPVSRPTASPSAAATSVCRTTSRRTCRRSAPIAMRIAISRVRRATMKPTMPASPPMVTLPAATPNSTNTSAANVRSRIENASFSPRSRHGRTVADDGMTDPERPPGP